MALSLSSVIKWILCLIGGLPLLQILAHTFNNFPIPFAKGGKFPPDSIKKLVEKIKKEIEGAKTWKNNIVNDFKKDFTLPTDIKTGLENLENQIRNFDNTLANTCPALFSKTGAVATARQNLLNKIGSINSYAEETTFLQKNLRQWTEIAADGTLASSAVAYRGHASEISGVLSDDEILILEPVPGYPIIGYANTTSGSNLISINLNQSNYPITNIGSTILIANSYYIITNKSYAQANAYVSTVNANSTIVYSKDYELYNLAELSFGNTTLQPGMSIRVNGAIARVNTINALGDYLTVTSRVPFPNANAALFIENGLYANTNINETTTNTTLKIKTFNYANSECLGDVITGNNTSFLSYFSANDSVYYDEKEFVITSLTQTEMVIDDRLRNLSNQPVYKIKKKASVQRTAESNGPDSILASFSVAEQMSANLGDNFIEGMTTRYRKGDGTYARVESWKPVHVTTAIQPEKSVLLNRGTEILQNLLDELTDDAINELTDSELVNYIEDKIQEIETIRRDLNDTIEQDLAAMKNVKSLISGLLKLFKISCSKKKKGDDPEDPDLSSDEYLNLVLMPNPERQGCDATQSDFIELIDEADDEYNTVELPDGRTDRPFVPETDEGLFITPESPVYIIEVPEDAGGANADISVDQTPDELLPETKNPCVEPC